MSVMKLGVVKEIIEEAGMGISYAYEDLVFLDHDAFLLQFTEESDKVLLHINTEANRDSLATQIADLKQRAEAKEMVFVDGKEYTLVQGEGEQLTLAFTS